MVLKKEEAIRIITDGLAYVQSTCNLRGLLHLFDSHVACQDFFCHLLNAIYDLQLEVADRLKPNFPAIDLGDSRNKRAFQVTTDKTSEKIQDTLDGYVRHGLAEQYGKLQIVLIGERQKTYNRLAIPDGLSFVWQDDIIDIEQLTRTIESLDTEKLERIASLVRREVGLPQSSQRQSSVVHEGFRRHEQFNFGPLYKMLFRIDGGDPGVCCCELSAEGYNTFAKWDQCPNPVRGDRLEGFDPGLVPATRDLRLYSGSTYSVPILIDDGHAILIFDGWWFSRRVSPSYYQGRPLTLQSLVSIALRGNGLTWRRDFTVQEIVRG